MLLGYKYGFDRARYRSIDGKGELQIPAFTCALQISYIFGGKDTLDLDLMLRKLYKLFNIRKVRIDGGGHVNGSFLKAGLIDEFSLVLVPLADGTMGSPTVFEAEDGYGKRKATHFRLHSVKKIFTGDFSVLRYQTVKGKK